MRFVVIGVLAICLLSVNGTDALASGAKWSTPAQVSPSRIYTESAAVASNLGGEEAVVWVDRIDPYDASIQVTERAAGGSFSSVQTISGVSGEHTDPAVAVGPNGEVGVLWTQETKRNRYDTDEVVEASFGSIGGAAFTAPEPVSRLEGGTGSMVPHIGISENGEVLVLWAGLDGKVHYANRAPQASTFSAPRAIRNPDGTTLFDPTFAISHSGTAIASWKDYGRLYAATAVAGKRFKDAKQIETTRCIAEGSSAAINEAGDAELAWTSTEGECISGATPTWVEAAYAAPGKQFGAPATVAKMNGWSYAAGAAVSPSGLATVACIGEMINPTSSAFATALTRTPSGTYEDPQPISNSNELEGTVALAYDTAGNLYAAIATRSYSPETGAPRSAILTASDPAGTSFTGSSPLQHTDGELDSQPEIVAGGPERATAIWETGVVGQHFRVEIATLR